MKFLAVLIFFCGLIFQNNTLEELRKAYPKAGMSKQNAEDFFALAISENEDVVVKSYQAAAKIIKAKFERGKNRKILISEGIKELQGYVQYNSNQLEIILIRLSIQKNLPKIIQYNTHIKEDKQFIIRNYHKQSVRMKEYFRAFVQGSISFSGEEKSLLKST